jgi:hypothetical protein
MKHVIRLSDEMKLAFACSQRGMCLHGNAHAAIELGLCACWGPSRCGSRIILHHSPTGAVCRASATPPCIMIKQNATDISFEQCSSKKRLVPCFCMKVCLSPCSCITSSAKVPCVSQENIIRVECHLRSPPEANFLFHSILGKLP